MPPVKKQLPPSSVKTAAPSVTGGILDRIRPVADRRAGMKFLVYGRGKTGKTRLACTFPKPMLLVGTEDGTESVRTTKDVDFVRIRTGDELIEIVDILKGGKYRTVGLDTGGGFQDVILKDVLGLPEVPVSKFKAAGKGETWGITDQKTWGIIGVQFKERMRSLLDLADTVGTHVVVIAHERNFNDDGTGDLIAPTVGAALTPSTAGWLNGACDYIGQAFLRPEVVKRKELVGKTEVVLDTKTGKVEYCLRIGPHEVFLTGFRVPDGVMVPDVIVNPTYQRIVDVIHGKGSK